MRIALLILAWPCLCWGDSCTGVERQIRALEQQVAQVEREFDGWQDNLERSCQETAQLIQRRAERDTREGQELALSGPQLKEWRDALSDQTLESCEALTAMRRSATEEERLQLFRGLSAARLVAEERVQLAQRAVSAMPAELDRARVTLRMAETLVPTICQQYEETLGTWIRELRRQGRGLQHAAESCSLGVQRLYDRAKARIDLLVSRGKEQLEVLENSHWLLPEAQLASLRAAVQAGDQWIGAMRSDFLAIQKRMHATAVCEELAQRELGISLKAVASLGEQPLTQGSKEEGYYVVALSYYPAFPKSLPVGKRYSEYLAELTPVQADFQEGNQPVFIHIAEEAMKKYPVKFFTQGKRFSTAVRCRLVDLRHSEREPLDLEGALLLKVADVYANYESLAKAYPPEKYSGAKLVEADLLGHQVELSPDFKAIGASPINFLEITSSEGLFTMDFTGPNVQAHTSGGPLVSEWPVDMQRGNIQLMHQATQALNCFVSTAILEQWSAPELDSLRRFRDLLSQASPLGRRLTDYYYYQGPEWAVTLHAYPWLKTLLKPALWGTVALVEWLDSENPATQRHVERVLSWLEVIFPEPTAVAL